jgi:transcriptional regulator with XRE-family HTH domain
MKNNNDKLTLFGERLRETCSKRGIRAQDLAKKTGISRNTISAYMNGKQWPNAEKFLAIHEALEISVDYLLTGEEQRVLAVGDASCLELPLHDPRPLQVVERRYLEKAVYVLRSPGIHGRPDEALASAIEETYDIVQASKR